MFAVLPLALVFGIILFIRLDYALLLTVFLVPLSVPLRKIKSGMPFDLYLPTELLLGGILVIFILKLVHEQKFDRRVLLHPVSISIYLYLFWMFITSMTSSLPIVSFKHLLAKIWFIVAFYFLATQLFAQKGREKSYIWAYLAGLIIVVIYTLAKHSQWGFLDQKAAHQVMSPFYNDHTSYGAILAMFLPVVIVLAMDPGKKPLGYRTGMWLLTIIFVLAITFSYTRAAWVSLIVALFVWGVMKLRIKFTTLVVFAAIIMGTLWSFRTEIFMMMEQNKQDSSADFSEHVQSIYNISSDASNVERLNRWASALKMFQERPVFGWGPGTYQFQYAPFQISYDKTIISTNFGDGGNAHSEYIGPLAESGIPGTLTFILIVVTASVTAVRVYTRSRDRGGKRLSMALFLGLVTYFTHGMLNNFLDTDKASAPFWGFIAILVAYDVYHLKNQDAKKSLEEE
jgi:O-antigen ligase